MSIWIKCLELCILAVTACCRHLNLNLARSQCPYPCLRHFDYIGMPMIQQTFLPFEGRCLFKPTLDVISNATGRWSVPLYRRRSVEGVQRPLSPSSTTALVAHRQRLPIIQAVALKARSPLIPMLSLLHEGTPLLRIWLLKSSLVAFSLDP